MTAHSAARRRINAPAPHSTRPGRRANRLDRGGVRAGRLSGSIAETKTGRAINALAPTVVFVPANSEHGQRGAWGA
jgi:hypothetical protein